MQPQLVVRAPAKRQRQVGPVADPADAARHFDYRIGRIGEEDKLASDEAGITAVVQPGGSDSAALDNVMEVLVHAGRPAPHGPLR